MTRRAASEWMVVGMDASGRTGARPDVLVGEEPMEIRVSVPGREAEQVSVTMRTPGHDFELAVGFLLTEGMVASRSDVRAVRYCELPDGEEQRYNIVTVDLARAHEGALARRAMVTSASCGVCGTASIDQLATCSSPLHGAAGPRLTPAELIGVADAVRAAQPTFDRTGGLHAAALFGDGGAIAIVREDVGRHNAVDKAVGKALLDGMPPLHGYGLFCSGRLSFEIIQKAAMAGVPLVAAVGAPSNLAAKTADSLGITVVGFLRDGRANVYTHGGRALG